LFAFASIIKADKTSRSGENLFCRKSRSFKKSEANEKMAKKADLTDGTYIAQFVILAKALKGKGLVGVIKQVLSAPNVYVFGELLEMENIQNVIFDFSGRSCSICHFVFAV